MTDPFMEAVKDKFPLQEGQLSGSRKSLETLHRYDISSAPDLNINTVFWCSLFGGLLGIDHFYVRSYLSGFLKLLTTGIGAGIIFSLVSPNISVLTGIGLVLIGITCGFWWLWDILQLSVESNRVLRYGMSWPLDLGQGIAQGMFAEETYYAQKANSLMPVFFKLFGWMGAGQEIFVILRILIIHIISAGSLYGVFTSTTIIEGLRNFLLPFCAWWLWSGFIIVSWLMDLWGAKIEDKNHITETINMFITEVKKIPDYKGIELYEMKRVNQKYLDEMLHIQHTKIPVLPGGTQKVKKVLPAPFLIWLFTVKMPAIFEYILTKSSSLLQQIKGAGTKGPAGPAVPAVPAVSGSQAGGAREEPSLSTESQILGATVIAILTGGVMKVVVDMM
jgi:hypothetical protein